MDTQQLKSFFLYSLIINGSLFLFWTFFLLFTPDLIYKLQYSIIALPRHTYDIVIYCFLGVFKILFLFFNVVPYIALRLISR